jgi:hypothetical protein
VEFGRSQIALVTKDLVHHLPNGRAPAKPRPISLATSIYIFTTLCFAYLHDHTYAETHTKTYIESKSPTN